MIPYNIDYCEEKIKEYKEKIKRAKRVTLLLSIVKEKNLMVIYMSISRY